MARYLIPILLLLASNVFMTFAWYYHLRHRAWPLLIAILVSWGIAFFEYVLQVPANRLGHVSHAGPFTAPQLKVIQEAITLIVFTVFSILVLREKLRTPDIIAFALIFLAVLVSVLGRVPPTVPPVPPTAAPSGRSSTSLESSPPPSSPQRALHASPVLHRHFPP